MAKLLITLLSFLLSFYAGYHRAQAINVTVGSKLKPGDQWFSPSGNFAFGFYNKGSGFALGIWLIGNQNETIVTWTAKRDIPPLPSNSSLEFTREGGLLISTEQNLFQIAKNFIDAASASLLDSGNFVIYNSADNVLWDSFDYPTDTILQGQYLFFGQSLVSSVSPSDRSSGRYTLDFQTDGNLVAYPIKAIDSYWATGTIRSSNGTLTLSEGGHLYPNFPDVLRNKTIAQSSCSPGKARTVYRATFDADGNFRLYLHILENSGNSSVRICWSALKYQCQVRGYCGANSYCSINSDADNNCICFPGFVHIDPKRKFLGCFRNFTYERFCGRNESSISYNITSIDHVVIGDYPYSAVKAVPGVCQHSCIRDCNCWAAQYADGNCNKYAAPVLFATLDSSISATTFIKQSSEIPQLVYRKRRLILILTPPLAFVAFLFTMLAVFAFLLYRKRALKYQKLLEMENLGKNKEFTLRSFSYSVLEKATDGFKYEIRSTSNWKIYEGIISEGNRKVAVGRLENFEEEGEREFKTEMTTLGRIHHKNVVQLVGFCLQGAKKLLVYQFMKNRSLADILYQIENRPTWKQRKGIAVEVARGIRYLHEECDATIVHCNIEPKNILVDDNWTAKISNFGSAKIQMPNQAENLATDREKGRYKAPEWQNSANISKKLDVYGYGFLLLEIISSTNNTEINVLSGTKEFSSWVYECFVAKELKNLIGDEDADMYSLERMVKVGLICIQDDLKLRPSMKDVVLMLEGIMDIPLPHSPN